MFNENQWYLNDPLDAAKYAYPPNGVPDEPPEFNLEFINPCSKGVYTGDIVLLGCSAGIGETQYDGRLGLGTVFPQQKLDVSGSVKIDKNLYDSVNSPGKIGYILSTDASGIRWVPPLSPPPGQPVFGGGPGVTTSFLFILDEGVPIY
jgi:hypothetical protein